MPVGRVHMGEAEGDHHDHHPDLDQHHHVVEDRGLGDAGDQDGGGEQQHRHRRHIEDGPGAHQVHPLPGLERRVGQDGGYVNAAVPHHAHEIARPAHRYGGGGEQIFDDQVPGDQPGHELAEGGVGVGVGRAGHRDHRRQLGVAQGRQGADEAAENVGDDDGRSGVLRRRLAGEHEDPRADHRTDAQGGQVEGAQTPLERMSAFLIGLGDQDRERLLGEKSHAAERPLCSQSVGLASESARSQSGGGAWPGTRAAATWGGSGARG